MAIRVRPNADDEGSGNTEGHATRFKGVEDAGDQNTEGHGMKGRPKADDDEMRAGRVEGDGSDTEGHATRVRILSDAGDDGTEGHGRRVLPKSDRENEVDDDQTEGHTYKIDPKARPGQRGGGATPDAAPTTRGWKRPAESGRAGANS